MAAAALLCSTALSSCDDDFARPPIVAPQSPWVGTENTTIAQFKEMYWQDANNYAAQIGQTVDGKDIIIKARVISSDLSSCLYQYLYVQDETGAMTIAARQLSSSAKLATQYGYGQEIYINATSLYAGRYAGLFQIGNSTDGTSTTFLDNSVLLEHVSANGLGQPDKIDIWTVTIPEVQAAGASQEELMKYQAHAVRFENVHFTQPGQAFVPTSGQDSSIPFADADGNSLIIRMNRYCTFGNTNVPSGTGTITGELGYFNGTWQMVINSIEDLEGFDFEGGDTPGTPEEPGTPEGEGTAASPFNSLKAYEFTKALAADATTDTEYYIKGKVSAVKELSTSFGNASYSIVSEGCSQAFDIFRGYYLNGDKFTAEDQLKVGDEVVVCGKLVNYKGNTPQMAQGGKIISINGQGSGDTPTTPTEGTIFSSLSEKDTELAAGWTIDNGTLPEGLTYVWSWKVYNNAGYLNASAFANGSANASEAYAISPVIDLTGATGVAVSFDHAAKFQTTLKTLCGIVVREEGATAWTALTIPTWPTAGAWTFANSGAISLEAYAGKKIQLAFKYGSTTEGADTWEIKNLVITGKK